MIASNMGFGARMLNKAGMKAIPYPIYGLQGLHGLGAHGDTPGPPYCTDFPDYASMLTYFGVELCDQQLPADQYACSLRNAPKLVQVANFQNNCSYPASYGPSGGGITPVNAANPYSNPYGGGYVAYGSVIPGYTPGNPYTQSNSPTPSQPSSYPINRCSNTYASQRVNYTSSNPEGTDILGTVARSLDCSCPSSGLDPSWNPATSSCSVPAPSPSAPPTGQGAGATYHPTLSFYNVTSGNSANFKVGDSFQISISGAQPNTSVYVSANGPSGSSYANMGNTDGNGNFNITGLETTNEIGNWQQTWTVGNANISGGSISFNVSANVAPTYNPPVQMPTNPPANQTTTPVNQATQQPSNNVGGNSQNAPTNSGVPQTNTTNTSMASSSGSMSDFFVGMENLFAPGNWGSIFSSGDMPAIAGLAISLGLVGFIVLKAVKVIR